MATIFNASSPSQSPIPSSPAVPFTAHNQLLLSCACFASLALISTITGFFLHNKRRRRVNVDIEAQHLPNTPLEASFSTILAPPLTPTPFTPTPFTPTPPNRQSIFGSSSPRPGSPARGRDSPSKPRFLSTTVSAVDPCFRDSDAALVRPRLRLGSVNARGRKGDVDAPRMRPMLRLGLDDMDAGLWAREASVNLDDVFEVSSPALWEGHDDFPPLALPKKKEARDRVRRYGLVDIAVSIEYSTDDGSHVRLSMKASCSAEHIQNALMKLIGATRRSHSSSKAKSPIPAEPTIAPASCSAASAKSGPRPRPRPRPLRSTPQRRFTDDPNTCQSASMPCPRTNSPLTVSFVWPMPRGVSLPLFSPSLTHANMQMCGCRSFLSMDDEDERDGGSGGGEPASTVFNKLVKGTRPGLGRMRAFARSDLGEKAGAQRYCILGAGSVSGVSSGCGYDRWVSRTGGTISASATVATVQTPRVPFMALPRLSMVVEDDESLRALQLRERVSVDDTTRAQTESAPGVSCFSVSCEGDCERLMDSTFAQGSCERSLPILSVPGGGNGDSPDLPSMIQAALEEDIVSDFRKSPQATKRLSLSASSSLHSSLPASKLATDFLRTLDISSSEPLAPPNPAPWPQFVTLKLHLSSSPDVLNVNVPENMSLGWLGSKVLSRLKRDSCRDDSVVDPEMSLISDSESSFNLGNTSSNVSFKLSARASGALGSCRRTISEEQFGVWLRQKAGKVRGRHGAVSAYITAEMGAVAGVGGDDE
ncbi:hypothetical protein CONPUDRAFT_164640 [Coniophora puteana RWD-64-598 SS2]|uniref:Uncharacterized protein n=1 Tax=Coniophora puteana (strain RWD-64-598) TaxID=741705 RepID=A0A5M3MTD6_CONPW|nr:uncharacterized protein CONPUDRAFT_164640 [Coniophora puteana RWD-64-598 SS2]EIW81925.1 hypothetical protein CONPUDRAFT_164640 [Coniophora puteana RWD-64-598 SS2]